MEHPTLGPQKFEKFEKPLAKTLRVVFLVYAVLRKVFHAEY